ncbi:MAG TPA: hypothetical protein VHB21_26200, partial [Minicystis sp.]|nr:hypothetical protein [Minicystis sp.]
MFLPGRLAASTLGDVLGALHRVRVTGVVELTEVSGANGGVPGRRHSITLADGLVADVDGTANGPGLAARLEALFALSDASIRFHVARRAPSAPPVAPRDFLHGRPRARDKKPGVGVTPAPAVASTPAPRPTTTPEERVARAVL